MPPRSRPPLSSLVEYGVVGDLHSAGLVSKHGSIDWLCLPRMDSPSVFAAILDEEKGGRMRVSPRDSYTSHQSYVAETNILRTQFTTSSGRAVLTDFMPVEEIDRDEYAFHEFHRVLEVEEGRVEWELEFAPRFDYARSAVRLEPRPGGVLASGGGELLALSSDAAFKVEDDAAYAEWAGDAGKRLRIVLRYGTGFVRRVDAYLTQGKLASTEAFWRTWLGRGNYPVPWRTTVQRSALALKLLTYAPTGALAAAATTSLPEAPGGPRNWDYRFSWVRDSSFAMQAFNALGHAREARRYLRWLRRLMRGLTNSAGELHICYGLEGEVGAPEIELDHFRGYLDSRPVRIGNAAIEQVQLDIYGSLLDAVFEAYQLPGGFPDEAWRTVRAVAEHVADHWEAPDHGIWEIRADRRRYTHSALMCWVALDRAVRIAEARGHPESAQRWAAERARIRDAILSQGWSEERRSFVQYFGGRDVDATLLLLPILGFLPGNDPRVVGTVEAVERDLCQGPYVYRYRAPDGLAGDEGAFLICSFWRVQALALVGRVEEARQHFESLNRLAGALGLFSENVEPATGRALGNFPQALTHLAHINAAVALARLLPPVDEPRLTSAGKST